MPRTNQPPRPQRLVAIARHARRHGGIELHRFGQLFVATDHARRLLCVMLYDDQHFSVSSVFDRPPTVRRVIARWCGPLPRPGEYLMTGDRARSAFQIARDPRDHNPVPKDYSGSTLRLGLDVLRVPLPLPPAAVVHRWRWTDGSRRGALAQALEK